MNHQGRDPNDFIQSGMIVSACLVLAALILAGMLAVKLIERYL